MLISLFLILLLVMVSCYLFNKTMIEGNKLNDKVDKSVNSFSVSELEEKNKDEKINETELSTNDDIEEEDNSTSIATKEQEDNFVNEKENEINSNVIVETKKEEDIDKKESIIDNSNIIENDKRTENEQRENNEKKDNKEDTLLKEDIDKVDENNNENQDVFNQYEYEKLKKDTYLTYEDCINKGIQLSINDETNTIVGSYCESLAYQGKLVGYKLYLRYESGKLIRYTEQS